jgi:hypothetical protein
MIRECDQCGMDDLTAWLEERRAWEQRAAQTVPDDAPQPW